MIVLVAVIANLILAVVLLFRFNGAWIYRVWHRAPRNGRDRLPLEYEIRRYCALKPDGSVDDAARWPGWDGWYFFLFPNDRDLPIEMARASLMTGLYGLEGIDNYDRLLLQLESFEAAEYLCLVPTAVWTPTGTEKRNNLSQHYLPKKFDLRIAPGKLDVAMEGEDVSGAVGFETRRMINPMDGPTITAVIDYGDRLKKRGFLIEDGGFPDVLRANLKRVPGGLATGRRLLRLLKNVFGKVTQNELAEGVFNQLDLESVRDALPYLAMGSDAADGDMTIDEEGRLQIEWHHDGSMPLWREIESALRTITEAPSPGLDGNLMLNPNWSAQKQLVTVHPLGGCPMGDDEGHGVFNPNGEVFNYPNLFVTDASIIPTAVGPNPSKTIGAMAERIPCKIIERGL
jgi:hypothetical protein